MKIETTAEAIQTAFTEWDRRYRENPEEFISEAYRLLKQDATTYGELATPYFINLLEEMKCTN